MGLNIFVTGGDVIKTVCHRNGDLALSKAHLYETYLTTVFNELRLDITHKSVIKKLYINKRTNSLPLPNDCLLLLGVGYENYKGVITPLWYNDKIPVELLFSNTKDCSCDTCGGEHTYCSVIKNFDEVEEEVEIDGTTYTKYVKTTTLIDGSVILTSRTPTLVRDEDGVETVEIINTQEELCKVELLACGCVANTPENVAAINTLECCCSSLNTNCGTYNKYIPKDRGYRMDFNEENIILDPDYPYDYIILRYVTTITSLKDYRIPVIALECMVYGIMYYSKKFETNNKGQATAVIDRALGGTWYNDYKAEQKKLSRRIYPNNYGKILGAMGVTSTKSIYCTYESGRYE